MNRSTTTGDAELEAAGTPAATRPVIVLRPSAGVVSIDWRELWNYRELLFFLAVRNLKIRYKQTAIGVAWAVLQPVVSTAILSVIFTSFARFDTRDVPYPLFALSGLLLWLFTHTAITAASGSFVGNTNLVTKVYFPRLIMPVAATLACVVDLLIGLGILAGLMIWFQAAPTVQVLLAPLFVILALILAAAAGTLFSALNVRFRDVQFALPFLLQVWMLASPVFYPTTILSDKWRTVFAVNPLTGILEGFRSAVFGTPFDWRTIGISCVSVAVIALVSLLVFDRMEDDFADMI